MKLLMEAFDPGLEHVRRSQLLRDDTQRRCLLTTSEPANGRARRVERFNKRLIVYAIAGHDNIN